MRLVLTSIALALASPAQATGGAIFGALGYPGDGFTPSFTEHSNRHTISVSGADTEASVSADGGVSRSFAVPLPIALLSPSVALTYNSQDGGPSLVSPGWSATAGATLRRPSRAEQTHVYADLDVWMYSGPGGSGPMVFDDVDQRWVLSSGSTPISATYDATKKTWTVVDGGHRITLAARVSGSPDPRSFRTTVHADLSGNQILYSYDGVALDEILFGGSVHGDLPTARVSFVYDDFGPTEQARVRRSWQEGAEELYDRRLARIEVDARADGGTWQRFGGLQLTYQRLDEVDRLVRVDQVGSDDTSLLGLAEMTYEPYHGTMTSTPFVLSDRVNHSVTDPLTTTQFFYGQVVEHRHTATSTTYTRSSLRDYTGDGLPDLHIETSNAQPGFVPIQTATWDPPSLFTQLYDDSWDPVGGWVADDVTGTRSNIGLDVRDTRMVAIAGSRSASATYATTLTFDVDGDGRLDTVSADPACGVDPVVYDSQNGFPTDGAPPTNGSFLWDVRYGGADASWPLGSVMSASKVDAPVACPKLSNSGGIGGVSGSVISLQDINGDGWADLVFARTLDWQSEPVAYEVFFKKPSRSEGWHLSPSALSGDASKPLHAAMTSRWEHSYQHSPSSYAPDSDLSAFPGGEPPAASTSGFDPTWGYNRSSRGILDLTGDGLPDFVVAAGPYWEVFPGNGAGFEPVPLLWDVTGEDVFAIAYTHTDPFVAGGLTQGLHVGGYGPTSTGGNPAVMDEHGQWGLPGVLPPPPPVDTGGSLPFEGGLGGSFKQLGLVDVDADGLLDLVITHAFPDDSDPLPVRWWKNLGSGFSDEQCEARGGAPGACPEAAWLDGGLHVATTRTDNRANPRVFTEFFDDRMVADVNHDGVLDVLDVEGGALLLGSYPKPGTLLEIDNLQDGRTTLTYAPSSDMAPAGDPAELQRNHLQLDLVTEVHTEDTLQGDVSRTTHVYADGEVRGGKFLGFETQETTSWEPRLVFDPATRTMPPAVDTEGDTWWYLRARTTTTHDLTRVGAQATSVAIDTDHALAVLSLSAHNGVQPDVDRRFTTTTSYEDVSGDGDGTCADQLGHLPRCLPVRREVTTHREQLQSMPGQPADATTVVELGYSPEGLIETVDEIDDSGVTPAMQTAITWTWDADHRHAVPMTKQLFGSHAMVGPQALLEEVRWSYGAPWGDYGDGLMSVQEVCSDEVGAATPCTESILWTFSRNARGVVDDVSAPDGGSQIIDDFAFGGAIPTTTRNALDHVTVHEADDLGRVTVTTDPNGVQTRTTFDPFGRPLVEAMTGVGGIERLTQQRTYFDGVPRRVTTQRFDGSDVVTSASKQSFDGFGHPFQSVDKVDVDTWISTEAFTDAFGRQRFTTEPETLALAGNLPIGGALTATEYDALGTARLHWSDLVGAPACFSATWEPGPRMTVQTDESGRNTGLRRDAFGRLVEVTEFHDGITHSVDCSESGTFRIPTRVVASYDWSGRGELQILSDPSTNGLRDRWWYDFDMAGRLQRTFRSADGDPVPNPANASIYSSYRFDEGRPDAMFWGTTTAPNSAVEWDYDPLGRVVAKRVRRDADGNDPTTWPEWQTTWDTHGGRSWLGMKLQERSYVVPGVGPSALTEWFYDGATVGDVGNLGRPSSVTRSFATDQTVATFAHEVDLYGDPVRTVFPSGAAVRTVRNDHGRVQQLEVGMPDGTSLKLDMTYDDYGIGSGFSSPGVHGQHIDRTSPTRLETVRWDAGTDAYGVRYAYGGDLRLLSRHYEHDLATLLPANALVYSYDWAGRVHTISWGGSVAESYSYDVIGNLHSVELGGEVWTYGAPGLFNAPTQRTSDAGILETATVDPATGRLLQVLRQDPGPLGGATHYSYDGTGKLHESWTAPTGGGSDGIRYVHDQDDVLIEKLHVEGNGNYTGSELYLDSWQLEYDHATGDTVAIESLTPAVRVRTVTPAGGTATSTREWLLREPDGHVLARFDDAGTLLSAEVVGLYGSPVHTVGTHPEEDGVHGMEGDHELGLVAMGVRHMAMRDGQWLQPEPLLHLGPPSDMLSNPRALFGPYAAGMGVTRHDRSGYAIETGWDAANVAMGVVSLGANVAAGNWFDAGVDAVGLVVDVAATAVPGVPGGAGTAIRAARTADKVVDAVSTSKTLARAGDKAGDVAKTGCFVAGTPVRTVDGDAAIEDIEVGDRVLAAVPDAMSQSPTDLDDTGSWLTRACDRVLRRARVAALPAFLMTACDVAEPPTAEASVEIYDARTGDWIDGEVRDGRVGTELRHDGHLFRITERGLLDLGAVDDSLDEADATYTGTEATRAPRADDWVLVLTRDDVAHDRLRRVTPGTRVAFQGRIFETLGNARVSQLLETDHVIGRVYQTHVREADGVFDLDIGYPDGSFGTVTGTHEHPFWVPSLQGWVALEDLRVGMVLQTSGGDEATVLGLSFRSGDTDVFNFEVEGAHDYFVFDRSGNHCVLVHNGCGPELPDDALVCRGGTCTADRFTGGSGVSTGPDGALDGVSTQSAPGASVEELAGAFQNNQVGVTTAGKIREAGGKVVADGTPRNPNHATVSGITAEQAEELFEVMPNPVPKGERGK